jgi:hypothetical protein
VANRHGGHDLIGLGAASEGLATLATRHQPRALPGVSTVPARGLSAIYVRETQQRHGAEGRPRQQRGKPSSRLKPSIRKVRGVYMISVAGVRSAA